MRATKQRKRRVNGFVCLPEARWDAKGGIKVRAPISCAFLLLVALSACTTYKYGGRDFRSEQQALAYQQEHLSAGVNKISPTRNKVGGTLRMYFVDQDVARSKLITGNQASAAADYVLKTIMADTVKVKESI